MDTSQNLYQCLDFRSRSLMGMDYGRVEERRDSVTIPRWLATPELEDRQRPPLYTFFPHHHDRKACDDRGIEKVSLLYYGKFEVSSCFKHSVIMLAKCELPQSQPCAILLDMHSAIVAKRRSKPITPLESFRTSCAEYLQSTVDKWQPSDHGCFESITREGQWYAS
jgi:hypothetical protein